MPIIYLEFSGDCQESPGYQNFGAYAFMFEIQGRVFYLFGFDNSPSISNVWLGFRQSIREYNAKAIEKVYVAEILWFRAQESFNTHGFILIRPGPRLQCT